MTAIDAAGNGRAAMRALAVDFSATPAGRSRLRPLLAGLVILGLGIFVSFGIAPVWDAQPTTQHARLTSHVVTALALFVAVVIADKLVERGARRGPTYALAVVCGALVGALAGWPLREALGLRFSFEGRANAHDLAQFALFHRLDQLLIGILLGGLATFVHVNRRTALAARRRQHEAERARARAQRRTLESQLQALQARVEPMFLFDTLERVRALYRVDAGAAGAMLEDLIVYLRAALPHLRESTSTLDKETTLVRSWFDIVARAAPDARFELAVDAALRGLPVPALVLLPLVQQAVGDTAASSLRLRLRAARAGDLLRIEVSTSTAAFAGGGGDRAQLEQIAQRLRALYGERARADGDRVDDPPFASRALIEWPLDTGDPARSD
jgi:hypothetical protein